MYDLIIPIYICIYLLIIILIASTLIFFLNRSALSLPVQKSIFILLGSFLAFPALLPAGTIAGIPVPNILFISLIACVEGIAGLAQIPEWYFKTWILNVIGLSIAGTIFWAIWKMRFFKQDETKPPRDLLKDKNLIKDENLYF
jgi:hypothetical protein